ncbi:MAG TPA: hypothetical protein VN523_08975 [Hyphomicrobiaceae bacterium]|nr:hypothetical protein [Hyphomicrobiaceae bacterium]
MCDQRAIRRFGFGALGPAPMPMRAFLTSGYIKRGDSPRARVLACGIGARGSISAARSSARHGEDRQFQRGADAYQRFNGAADQFPNPCVAPLEQPPFYPVRVVAGELGTFAGIATPMHK